MRDMGVKCFESAIAAARERLSLSARELRRSDPSASRLGERGRPMAPIAGKPAKSEHDEPDAVRVDKPAKSSFPAKTDDAMPSSFSALSSARVASNVPSPPIYDESASECSLDEASDVSAPPASSSPSLSPSFALELAPTPSRLPSRARSRTRSRTRSPARSPTRSATRSPTSPRAVPSAPPAECDTTRDSSGKVPAVPSERAARTTRNGPQASAHVRARRQHRAGLRSERPPRFAADDPQLLEHLHAHGYAVVAAAADETEVATATSLLWDFLEKTVGMCRTEPGSWSDGRFRQIGNPATGIVSGHGFGHAEVCWFARLLPNVQRAFAQIWDTERLVTSFDGGNIFRPFHRISCGSQKTSGGWWHVDQGRTKHGLHAVQGLLTLRDVRGETGGFCVVPGSHRGHSRLVDFAAWDDGDFVMVPKDESGADGHDDGGGGVDGDDGVDDSFGLEFNVRDGVMLECDAGDLVLWDSRTVHCNAPALSSPTDKGVADDELLRAVLYVCMTPAERATEEVLRLRRRSFIAGVGTTHWPHTFVPLGNRGLIVDYLDSISDAQVDEIMARLDPVQRRLIGGNET
mmetsp:Transcript_32466/g.62523  ORF Transcript_32466/g.62523 Transcript_32466/m.62523 type:complete len:577 (+) Transcript_32466:134-1864(+)